MKIDKNVIDELNQTVSITLEKTDYEPKFKSELKKQAAKAQIKGFRKGKTPTSVVKKMYGQNVLLDVINQSIERSLNEYLTTEKLEILGQPIPSEDQDQQPPIDVNDLKDFTFKFDLGISPEFKIDGVGKETSYDIYDVTVGEDLIDQEVDHVRSQFGAQESVEDVIQDKDIITIEAEELEGKKIKKDGWATTFNVIVDSLDDKYKKQLMKMKSGDDFTFDVLKLEKDRKEEYINKYLLNRTPEDADVVIGNDFKGKVKEVKRLIKADFDQELYDNYFGKGEVSSEEEAREKIGLRIKEHYDKQSSQIMYKDIMDNVIAKTEIGLPENFLKRWLILNNEEATEADIEKEMDNFLDNLKWTLVKNKLSKDYDVTVEPEEVKGAMTAKVQGYFRQYGMDPGMAAGVMDQMMQNREEVNKTYEELQSEKIFAKVGDEVKKKKKKVSHDKFVEIVKELNAKQPVQ